MCRYIIGIDPDTEKNGVAIMEESSEMRDLKYVVEAKLTLTTMRFFDLFQYLKRNADQISHVRVEAGWLNKKANWHNNNKGPGVAARIGSATGANAEVGRKICEMLDYLHISYDTVKPLKKIWKNGKISHAELESLLKRKLPRTNQESRDAALLII